MYAVRRCENKKGDFIQLSNKNDQAAEHPKTAHFRGEIMKKRTKSSTLALIFNLKTKLNTITCGIFN